MLKKVLLHNVLAVHRIFLMARDLKDCISFELINPAVYFMESNVEGYFIKLKSEHLEA